MFVEAAGEGGRLNADIVSVQALSWHGDRLWVGDIGDEDAERDHIVVYRLSDTETAQGTYHAYDYRYEDGPHDAKAMLISGRGNVYIVTSGEDPGIYRIRGEASRSAMNTLVRVHDAPEGVTDGVFSPTAHHGAAPLGTSTSTPWRGRTWSRDHRRAPEVSRSPSASTTSFRRRQSRRPQCGVVSESTTTTPRRSLAEP